jgi:hypothetical protein
MAKAVRVGNDKVPNSWGHSLDMARIACNESDFRTKATNSAGGVYGLAHRIL